MINCLGKIVAALLVKQVAIFVVVIVLVFDSSVSRTVARRTRLAVSVRQTARQNTFAVSCSSPDVQIVKIEFVITNFI